MFIIFCILNVIINGGLGFGNDVVYGGVGRVVFWFYIYV